MLSPEQLRQEIDKCLDHGVDWEYQEVTQDAKDKLLALIEKAKREAVDEFQDRLDEKEFTLGGDTTTPAIVYQWMQEVTDEMFPKSE